MALFGAPSPLEEHGFSEYSAASTMSSSASVILPILALIVGPIDFIFCPPRFWVFIFIISPFQSEVNNYFQLEKNN
jgi:ABC-type multidrug transport system permease subunit